MVRKKKQAPSIKVLLDTDIGSDIDDAVALAYLLAQPRCTLLGITTVSGEAYQRACLASALCRVAGKNIPVVPGSETPILIEPRQKTAPQAKSLARWPHQNKFKNSDAVIFLRDTIRQHPGEITLLSIGPLTNVGLLFALDPDIPGLLKAHVMMGGVFFGNPRVEWNIVCDPQAAAMVYRAPVKMHRSIGLDVTLKVQMAKDEVVRRFTHPLLVPVLDFARHWFKERGTITFHDPLAAVTLFDDRVCSFVRGRVTVDLDENKMLGRTVWNAHQNKKPHQIAKTVDAGRFFRKYFEVFEKK